MLENIGLLFCKNQKSTMLYFREISGEFEIPETN